MRAYKDEKFVLNVKFANQLPSKQIVVVAAADVLPPIYFVRMTDCLRPTIESKSFVVVAAPAVGSAVGHPQD